MTAIVIADGPILLSEFLAGHTPRLFWPNMAVLAAMATLFLSLTFFRLQKRLDR